MGQHSKSVNMSHACQIEAKTAEQTSLAASEQDRREALRKIGRYSVYAAPVMMAMLTKRAVAGS